jgi:hypothetical protein
LETVLKGIEGREAARAKRQNGIAIVFGSAALLGSVTLYLDSKEKERDRKEDERLREEDRKEKERLREEDRKEKERLREEDRKEKERLLEEDRKEKERLLEEDRKEKAVLQSVEYNQKLAVASLCVDFRKLPHKHSCSLYVSRPALERTVQSYFGKSGHFLVVVGHKDGGKSTLVQHVACKQGNGIYLTFLLLLSVPCGFTQLSFVLSFLGTVWVNLTNNITDEQMLSMIIRKLGADPDADEVKGTRLVACTLQSTIPARVYIHLFYSEIS